MSFRKLLAGFALLIGFVFFLTQSAASGVSSTSYPKKKEVSTIHTVNKVLNSTGKYIP